MKTLARLVLLGAFACGSAVSQEASTPAGPPNIQVVSRSWVHIVVKTKPQPTIPNSQTVERSDTHPLAPIDPTSRVTEIDPPRQIYVYSAEILNAGSGDIQALSWDYLFTDPVTHDELKRQTGFSVGKIHVNQKKKLLIRTPSSPPKVISAGSLKATARHSMNTYRSNVFCSQMVRSGRTRREKEFRVRSCAFCSAAP